MCVSVCVSAGWRLTLALFLAFYLIYALRHDLSLSPELTDWLSYLASELWICLPLPVTDSGITDTSDPAFMWVLGIHVYGAGIFIHWAISPAPDRGIWQGFLIHSVPLPIHPLSDNNKSVDIKYPLLSSSPHTVGTQNSPGSFSSICNICLLTDQYTNAQ